MMITRIWLTVRDGEVINSEMMKFSSLETALEQLDARQLRWDGIDGGQTVILSYDGKTLYEKIMQ